MVHLSFGAQAAFFSSHDVLVAAHGAALTWAAFLKPCAAVVVLHATDYSPIFYFERLIEDSGGIAIPWWDGAYLGDDPAQREASQQAVLARSFAAGSSFKGRSEARNKNIHIEPGELEGLLDRAYRHRARCLAGDRLPKWVPPEPPFRDRAGQQHGPVFALENDNEDVIVILVQSLLHNMWHCCLCICSDLSIVASISLLRHNNDVDHQLDDTRRSHFFHTWHNLHHVHNDVELDTLEDMTWTNNILCWSCYCNTRLYYITRLCKVVSPILRSHSTWHVDYH